MESSMIQLGIESFDKTTFHRGKNYAQQGKVSVISSAPTQIKALVTGSQETPYEVNIYDGNKALVAVCSCPQKYRCKHIVATLIHLSLESGEKVPSSHKNPSKKQVHLSEEEKDWIEQISNTHKETADSPIPPSGIFYIFSKPPGDSPTSESMNLAFHIARRKKGGNLSQAIGTVIKAITVFDRGIPEALKKACEESDKEILSLLWEQTLESTSKMIPTLKKIVDTGRAVWEKVTTPPLVWGEEKQAILSWEFIHQSQQLNLQVEGNEAIPFLFSDGALYVDPTNHTCGPLRLPEKPNVIRHLLSAPPIKPDHLPIIEQKLKTLFPTLPLQKKKRIILPPQKGRVHLFLKEQNHQWSNALIVQGTLSFLYGEHKIPAVPVPASHFGWKTAEATYELARDVPFEKRVVHELRSRCWFGLNEIFRKNFPVSDLTPLIDEIQSMKRAGWIVEVSESFPIQDVISADQDWYVEVNEAKNHWFDLEIGQKINGKRVNLIPYLSKFISQYSDNNPHFDALASQDMEKKYTIALDNGEVLVISLGKLKAILEPFLGLLNEPKKGGKLELPSWQAGALGQLKENLHKEKLEWESPARYTKMIDELQQLKKIELVTPPKGLKTDLRHYQLVGLSWLQFLRRYQLAGILADDMGLGKTIQTLAHILLEKEEGRLTDPVLVIAPTTLMGNWSLEAEKFTPSLKVLILQGADRKRHYENISQYDLILTTYPLLSRDKQILCTQKYHLLILDEAQNIKNAKTQAHQVLRSLQAKHRLCLTGTPMENHLGELWSIFTLILPGFLGDEKQFQKLFRKPIEKEGSLERKKILQKRIAPFLLRRTKQEVIQELPPKTEIITTIELTEKQQELYEAVRLTMMNKVMAEVEAKGLARSRIVLLDALLKLRQICCDPRLLKTVKGTTSNDSSKLLHLKELLPELIENGRKILLFSQFTSMLKLIEEQLRDLKIPYVIITGETEDRNTPVRRFQGGEVPLFLISLKAGGTGLNLTAADTVIHYDPWWNPAVENQATDRAHRMGQTKSIFVYKWIASGSVEEKILQMQAKKKALADSLFDASSTASLDLNLEDLQSLFAPLA